MVSNRLQNYHKYIGKQFTKILNILHTIKYHNTINWWGKYSQGHAAAITDDTTEYPTKYFYPRTNITIAELLMHFHTVFVLFYINWLSVCTALLTTIHWATALVIIILLLHNSNIINSLLLLTLPTTFIYLWRIIMLVKYTFDIMVI